MYKEYQSISRLVRRKSVELNKLTAAEFRKMFELGAEKLEINVDLVNALNVFPVPDGDTGTNMNLSFQSGIERMHQTESEHVGEISAAIAKGLLMGARGNSGVILSQIFRGFSQAIVDKETLTAEDFVQAFLGGVEAAYKAVMKPVEGTILTVARESAIRGENKAEKETDIIRVMESIVKGADESLEKTPELLPVLKQVGVVDSGGKGLLCIYEGFLAGLKGEVVDKGAASTESAAVASVHAHAMFDEINDTPMSMEEINYGYCTEIMVKIGQGPTVKKEFNYEEFRQILNEKGDSLLVISDEEIVKVHVHTEDPGEIMQLGQEFGELIKIKVDNMREQVRELENKEHRLQEKMTSASKSESLTALDTTPKKYAIIGVASGAGLIEMLESIGVSEVISGGQTMNPSTEDFIKAIGRVNAENIIILPNNKNILMAAEQAAEVAEVPTAVIPTRSITQGIAAMLMYNPDEILEHNREAMAEYAATVVSGQITNAIRDTEINDLSIKKDDFMGILDGEIVLSNPELEDTLTGLVRQMLHEEAELVTIIVGEDGSLDMAGTVESEILADYPELEFEIIQGDQPVYHYFVSVD